MYNEEFETKVLMLLLSFYHLSNGNSTLLTPETKHLGNTLDVSLFFTIYLIYQKIHMVLLSKYTSNTFRDYLRALGVKQSFSNTATPYNNSVMESFFKSMKTERLYRTDYRSERELRESVREYINYYNNDRPHSVLRYQTPEYFESKYYSSIGVYKESESNTDGSNLAK